MVPDGFEDEVDNHRFDAFHTFYLRAYILQDEVGGRAGRGREGHVDIHRGIVLDVYLIDHAKVPDVDGNLGVVDGFEHIDDAFFYLRFFFWCDHVCE